MPITRVMIVMTVQAPPMVLRQWTTVVFVTVILTMTAFKTVPELGAVPWSTMNVAFVMATTALAPTVPAYPMVIHG